MVTPTQQDASFFGSIHSLLQQQAESAARPLGARRAHPEERVFDRRASNRRPYNCPQLVAPYDGRSLPAQAAFRLVDCQDISPSGFSFLSESVPDYQYLVIALGIVPFAFFSAEIVRVEQLPGPAAESIRVGCRFLQRIGTRGSS